MTTLSESSLEHAALELLRGQGYAVVQGPNIDPDKPNAERTDWNQTTLDQRLKDALHRINPDIPTAAIDEAFRTLTTIDTPALIDRNHAAHWYIVNGVSAEYLRPDGTPGYDPVKIIDFEHPENNDWLAVNQFTVVEGGRRRRADIVLFVNGLPLAVIELKNPTKDKTDIWEAFNQLQTYKAEIPALFGFAECLVISDGYEARIGTLTSSRERFMPWRTIEGEGEAPATINQLEVLLKGVFEPGRFLNLIRFFTVYERERDKHGDEIIIKKQAGYHQYHAVMAAVEATVEAANPKGDRRIGVVWHTQGSGKSLTMAFYAGACIWAPELENPTIVVLTDRNDLDDQLFGTFSKCSRLLRQEPVQAEDRGDLRAKLSVAAGGVVFTTIQKFFPDEKGDKHPELSRRRNIIVIADEAHRTQYGFASGFAKHVRDALPGASFIGFTGTPVSLEDKNTREVFGDYVSVYDIQQAVKDKATVPIYYEGRLAKLDLPEELKPKIDAEVEEVTEGQEEDEKRKVKTKWAALEAVVGTERRLAVIAEDLVRHFEARDKAMAGKAMIVCMSRRVCVAMYDALVKLRPEWHGATDEEGALKVVMTGSAGDPEEYRPHVRPKAAREVMANRFRNPNDGFKIVIVRDMWLTGFDAPCLTTMYLDKPMHGHNLVQAIARVNRVFKDKPGGLVVDYLGIADSLKQAVGTYSASGGKGDPAIDKDQAVGVFLEKHQVCCDLMHGFDWSGWTKGPAMGRMNLLAAGRDFALGLDDGKARVTDAVRELSQAFALAVPDERATRLADDVAFFQAIRAGLLKFEPGDRKSAWEVDHAVRQIVAGAVISEGVIDIFSAAGIKKPDVSILDESFLQEVRDMPRRNLAVELLQKLLGDEIRKKSRTNLVKSKAFSEMLEASIRKYHLRAVSTAEILEELIRLAKEVREDAARGVELNLSEAEIAFYDALEVNDSAVKVLGDDLLRVIARELAETVKHNTSIDWTMKESVRAKLRLFVKRILKKYGYPPDKQEKATDTVLEQAALLSGSMG